MSTTEWTENERSAAETRYMQRVWVDTDMTREGLREETTVSTIDAQETQQSPLCEDVAGQYCGPDQRVAATGDEGILTALSERGLFPGFLEAGPRELLRIDPCRTRAVVVATGGTAPGTNAVIHAIVARHRRYAAAAEKAGGGDRSGGCRERVLGILNGFEGLMAPRPWPAAAVPGPAELTPEQTERWRDMAGCHLGLSRYDFSAPGLVEKAAENLLAEQINIVYVISGDGGIQAALRLSNALRKHPGGRNTVVAAIPKTMDNDVAWVRRSLGYRTALAEAARILNVLHTDAEANRRVVLVELFGADAGFVTAGAAFASGKPDCVLIPEQPFDPWQVVAYVADRARRQRNALVVLAEGALLRLANDLLNQGQIERGRPPTGVLSDPWYERRDLHSLALRWLRDQLRAEFVRPEVFTGHVVINQPGYLIRAVPPSAEDLIYAERLGDLAVDSALAGHTSFMITEWLGHYVLVPLALVGRVERRVPRAGVFWREVLARTGQPALA